MCKVKKGGRREGGGAEVCPGPGSPSFTQKLHTTATKLVDCLVVRHTWTSGHLVSAPHCMLHGNRLLDGASLHEISFWWRCLAGCQLFGRSEQTVACFTDGRRTILQRRKDVRQFPAVWEHTTLLSEVFHRPLRRDINWYKPIPCIITSMSSATCYRVAVQKHSTRSHDPFTTHDSSPRHPTCTAGQVRHPWPPCALELLHFQSALDVSPTS